jgi:hypothetical protein
MRFPFFQAAVEVISDCAKLESKRYGQTTQTNLRANFMTL